MKALALLFFLLSGCATVREISSTDGSLTYNIACNGSGLDWGHCYSRAAEMCGILGYEVIAKDSDADLSISWVGGGSYVKRNLVIKCITKTEVKN